MPLFTNFAAVLTCNVWTVGGKWLHCVQSHGAERTVMSRACHKCAYRACLEYDIVHMWGWVTVSRKWLSRKKKKKRKKTERRERERERKREREMIELCRDSKLHAALPAYPSMWLGLLHQSHARRPGSCGIVASRTYPSSLGRKTKCDKIKRLLALHRPAQILQPGKQIPVVVVLMEACLHNSKITMS